MEDKGFPQKKVLSLVLCVAVMLSVMVMGAGAAFSDQDKIENTEAVNMCTALNILGGYEDGSFHPERNIKRSEITKMICVALNGGKEPNVSTNVTPTFNDVRGTNAAWAEGYIESCVAQGIISGVGGGRFSPNGNVTGTQLAKMLLVSLGYNANTEGFVGNAWATNVNVIASQKGLYEGLERMDTSAAITRDNAAQMVWNAMNAYEVEYKTTIVTDENGKLETIVTVQDKVVGTNRDKITLLEDKYEAKTFTGTFNGDSNVLNIKDGQIQVDGSVNETSAKNPANFTYDFDLKYIGEEVKVLFKDGTGGTANQPDDKDTIYGVVVTGATTVYNIAKGDLQDQKKDGTVRFGDENYDVAAVEKNDKYIDINGGASTITANSNMDADAVATDMIEKLKATNGDTIKFVCNDSGEIVMAFVNTYAITKVTAVNSTKVSLEGVGAIEIEDNDIYSGIAKDDVVVYQKLYDTATAEATFVVTKAETITGTLDGYKETKKVTVDGTTYSTMNEELKDGLTDDAVNELETGHIGDEVTLYLVNGYVAAVDVAENASNYAYVIAKNNVTSAGGVDDLKLKVMLADNTEVTVIVDEDGDVTENFAAGQIIKYASISDSNVMDVSEIVSTTNAQASSGNLYDKDTKTFDGIMTTADAVLFVKTVDGSNVNYYAYNIRSLGNITASAASSAKYIKDDDGKVEVAFVQLASKPSGATTDTVYGIVTAAKGTVKVGDEYKSEFTVANNEKEYTVYLPAKSDAIAKGDIISFELVSDNIYSNSDVTVYDADDAVYVDELDKDNVLSYYQTIDGDLINKALDDDAQIVYVDQDKDAAGDDIGVGAYDTITDYANAVVVLDSNGTKIVAIIVESSGDCSVVNGLAGTKVDADKVLEAPDGVSTLVTKEGTKTTINLSGRVEEGIPSELGTVFSGGTDTGITTVTLKGLVPTDDSTVTITQVNKAMNAYYGADQFSNDTKSQEYSKTSNGGESDGNYSLLVKEGEAATVTVSKNGKVIATYVVTTDGLTVTSKTS